MIIGIGTDIIEIDRINKAINANSNFLMNLFTAEELNQYNQKKIRVESVAGNFAAKEAVSKALGTGFRGFGFSDIEILRDDLGKPIVRVSEKIEKIIGNKNYNFYLSISHNKSNAIAYCILEVI